MFGFVTYPLHFWLVRGSVLAFAFPSSSQAKRIGNITLSFSSASFSTPSTTLFPSIGLDVFTGPCTLNGWTKSSTKKVKKKKKSATGKVIAHLICVNVTKAQYRYRIQVCLLPMSSSGLGDLIAGCRPSALGL